MTSSERPLSKISVDDRIPEAGAWARLRTFTPARIGLARAGVSIAAGPLLDFRAAHAAARDAVMAPLNVRALVSQLASLRFSVMTAVLILTVQCNSDTAFQFLFIGEPGVKIHIS